MYVSVCKMCVCVGGVNKEAQGKTQVLLKKNKKTHIFYRRKEKSTVLPTATQIKRKVQGKLISKNK